MEEIHAASAQHRSGRWPVRLRGNYFYPQSQKFSYTIPNFYKVIATGKPRRTIWNLHGVEEKMTFPVMVATKLSYVFPLIGGPAPSIAYMMWL